jgi:hypothetical protein
MLAAQTLNLQVFILEVRASNELDDAFSEMTRIGVGALSVLESPLMALYRSNPQGRQTWGATSRTADTVYVGGEPTRCKALRPVVARSNFVTR